MSRVRRVDDSFDAMLEQFKASVKATTGKSISDSEATKIMAEGLLIPRFRRPSRWERLPKRKERSLFEL